MGNAVILALISSSSALVGAALGVCGGYLTSRAQATGAIRAAQAQAGAAQAAAREQIRASTIVATRQRWIDELRAELSKMIGALLQLQITLEERTEANQEIWLREVITASALEAKINLLLNPNEPEHEVLVVEIRKALNALREGKRIEWGDQSTSITIAGRRVLKEAWDQIKAEANLVTLAPSEAKQMASKNVAPIAVP